MARSAEKPAPPLVSPPDLPARLETSNLLQPRADHFQLELRDVGDTPDASHATVAECRFSPASVQSLTLTGAQMVDVVIEELRATMVSGRGARLRRVLISGGRIGTLDLADAELFEVELRGIRVDYISLAAARIENVIVADCVIGALDLPQSVASRVRFDDSRADELDTRGLRAQDVDLRGLEVLSFTDAASLRGTTLGARQIEQHASAFAASLGIDVRD